MRSNVTNFSVFFLFPFSHFGDLLSSSPFRSTTKHLLCGIHCVLYCSHFACVCVRIHGFVAVCVCVFRQMHTSSMPRFAMVDVHHNQMDTYGRNTCVCTCVSSTVASIRQNVTTECTLLENHRDPYTKYMLYMDEYTHRLNRLHLRI